MIEPADLVWRDGQPFSPSYNDIYHDRDGSAEVRSVFLEPAGFDALLATGRRLLVAELGFGTALNFAVIARHCLAAGVPLEFISFDAHPVAPALFQQICRDRQAAEPVYADLGTRYPPLIPGWHRRRLGDGQVTLTVFWGTARDGLAQFVERQRQPVDLWLLDGFSPDRNPDMWTADVFEAVRRTARTGTWLTTFSSVGRVRRGLTDAGFAMRRINQRPRKWESLAGSYQPQGRPPISLPEQVNVVGAGIAGATVARELAESGVAVTVREAAEAPASGASSIPVTVMHPRLHHDGSPAAEFRATAYAHAVAAVQPWLARPEAGIRTSGALQIASANYPVERLAAVAERYQASGLKVRLVDRREANELAGLTAAGTAAAGITGPALWFEDACLVQTPVFTRALLDHPLIRVQTHRTLTDWPAGPAVLACGFAARSFPGAAFLELGVVHGQLDALQVHAELASLRTPVVGNGYVAPMPAGAGRLAAGATYEYRPWPAAEASAWNSAHVVRLGSAEPEPVAHYRAARCVSSDRNPVIGALHDLEAEPDANRLVSTGHGSMGTVTSHLAAALIDARLRGQLEPLDTELLGEVSSLRFRNRQARRGYRFGARA